MFVWILALVLVVTFFVINWAVLGDRLSARKMGIQVVWAALGLLAWRVCAELLKSVVALNELIALVLLVALLVAGYYHLHLYRRAKAESSRSGVKKPARKKTRRGR